MTSDTKVGLLLGLLFIFVIAFLINGLPSFNDLSADGNELLINSVSMDNNAPGLAQNEQNARQRLFSYTSTDEAAPTSAWQDNTGRQQQTEPPRYVTAAPQSQSLPVLLPVTQEVQAVAQEVLQQQILRPASPQRQTYKVQEGDRLATIAMRFYGKKLGNTQAVIDQLFEANRSTLKSPDLINVGQTLIIPTIQGSDGSEVIMAANFIPVQNMQPVASSPVLASNKPKSYTVKDGDSLWKIAQHKLGDGNRYTEIAKLNRAVLGDEDAISVGMKLRLPQ